MNKVHYATLLVSFFITAVGCGDGGGRGTTDPTPTATLTGIIHDQLTGGPVAGAAVRVGSLSTTTAADGRFELQGAPIGPAVTIEIRANGFDIYTATIAVQPGSNSHQITLVRSTLFDITNFTLHLPPALRPTGACCFWSPAQAATSVH